MIEGLYDITVNDGITVKDIVQSITYMLDTPNTAFVVEW